MLSIKEIIKTHLRIIRAQKDRIKLLEQEIQEIENTMELRLYEDLAAISGEYKSMLDPQIVIPGSYEHRSELFKTSTSNIACYFSCKTEGKGKLTKIILLEKCESQKNSFRITNEIDYRISLEIVQKNFDQQQIHLAQISRDVFVNVAYYELFKRNDQCIVKSENSKIEDSYKIFEISDNFINSFQVVKNNNKRIEQLEQLFSKRNPVQKNPV